MNPKDRNGLPGPFVHTDLGLTWANALQGLLGIGVVVGFVLVVVLLAPAPVRLAAPASPDLRPLAPAPAAAGQPPLVSKVERHAAQLPR